MVKKEKQKKKKVKQTAKTISKEQKKGNKDKKKEKKKEIKPEQMPEQMDVQSEGDNQEVERESQELRGILKYKKTYELKAVYSQYQIEYCNNFMFVWGISEGVLNIFNRELNRVVQRIEHKDEEIVAFSINP